MTEKVADPRTGFEITNDYIDHAPGFADLMHRYNLIGDFERPISPDDVMAIARDAYVTAIDEYRKNPKEYDRLESEYEHKMAELRS